MHVHVTDEATPWLNYFIDFFPAWERKALKSAGWWMSKEIKKGIKSKAPGGKKYPAFMPAKKRRALEGIFGRKEKRSYAPMGALARAVGYQYFPSSSSVIVGWLSNSATKLGLIMEEGEVYPVTDEMRLAFAAAGVPIDSTTKIIDIPPRPTIGPMAEYLKPKVAGYMEEKVWEYEKKGVKKVKKKKKKYKVYSKFF